MAKETRFYMARITKRGELSTPNIIEALRNPETIEVRGTRYSFMNFIAFGAPGQETGFYAKLVKYKQKGEVGVVHEDRHELSLESVDNMIEAESAFVYLPGFSGLAYRNVWNSLTKDQFERVFVALIEQKYQQFFVGCDIEPVTDLRTFVMRLAKLDRITTLEAFIKPPNPLFGPCWESLGKYVKKRELDELKIKEESPQGINTNVLKIAQAVMNSNEGEAKLTQMMETLLDGVGDAALLMAADGFGKAKVVGLEDSRSVTIRTSENQKSFLLDADPDPKLLFDVAFEQFQKINDDRYLRHP
jgi:hypothetical protein